MMSQKNQKTGDKSMQDVMVFVTHAENLRVAEDYALKLKNKGIPCKIEDCGKGIADFGFGLFVPEQFYEEAHMVIESQRSDNSFYDFFFDDTPLDGCGEAM